MNLRDRFLARFRQYRIESGQLAAAMRSLAVNLEYMDRLGVSTRDRIVVVDSWREAILLRALGRIGVMRRCTASVVTRAEQLVAIADASHRSGRPVVLTLRVCSRHYQTVAALRRRVSIVVL